MKEKIVELKFWRENSNAYIPKVAYNNSSAAFDLLSTEDTVIPARGHAMIPVGIRIQVPDNYYIEFATRSGHGIGKNLKIHEGIIDPGYSGEWAVKMFNLGNKDQIIERGKAAVQCKVHKIRPVNFTEITKDEFDEYRQESVRGDNGFGSSDKK